MFKLKRSPIRKVLVLTIFNLNAQLFFKCTALGTIQILQEGHVLFLAWSVEPATSKAAVVFVNCRRKKGRYVVYGVM